MNTISSLDRGFGIPVLGAVLATLLAIPVAAQPPGGKGGNDLAHFGELTKDTEHLTGYMDLYRKKDKVLLEIPVERIGRDFLLIQSLSRGIGERGVLGGMPTDIFDGQIVRFERRGDRVHLVQVNHRFRAPEGSPAAAAVDLTFGNSILASLDIVSERHEGDEVGVVPEPPEEKDKNGADAGDGDDGNAGDDGERDEGGEEGDGDTGDDASGEGRGNGAGEAGEEPGEVISVVVDYSQVLISDLPNLSEGMSEALESGYKLDKDRSSVESIKVFPENAEFEMNLAFTTGKDPGLETVIDSRYITLGLHHSYSDLPAEPMRPRYGDPRVGYFLSVHKDFSRDREDTYFVRYINRWRLEKQNPNRSVSRPVEPIVFYVENTWPEAYRKYVKRGIEAWQKAFEAAGFEDAIVARDQPEGDPDWAAEDVRYSTIRYITTHRPGFGAIGPSRVDPRTGEILDADILFDANRIQGLWKSYQRMAEVAAPRGLDPFEYLLDADRISWDGAVRTAGVAGAARLCSAGDGLAMDGAFAGIALAARGDIRPGGKLPEEFVGQAITWITMHEVGHTLGLRHNFKASMSCPYEKLHDRSYVKQYGLYGSVMDYPGMNIAPEEEDQGYYYTPVVGTYDDWAIRYGYTEFRGSRSAETDREHLARIAAESADPLHYYGTDEDYYMPGSADAFTNARDLGDDPMAWARERSEYIVSLYAGLADRMVAEGASWSDLTDSYNALLAYYYRAMQYVPRYVAGMATSRSFRGDPGAGDPLVPLSTAKQREAIAFVARKVFTEEPFALPEGFMEKLGPDRWNHWGSRPGARTDFPYHARIAALQRPIIDRLTHPVMLHRLLDAEAYGPDAFTLVELFDAMDGAIWTEVGGTGSPESMHITAIRRGAQRMWLDRMIRIAFTPDAGTPDDARSVARMNLVDLAGRIAGVLDSGAVMEGYTRAHLMDCHARIATALEAGYELEVLQRTGG